LLVMMGCRYEDLVTREHMLNLVTHQKELNFSPGDEYLYCNTGYDLLAEIVARVSGQSFADFAEANIFKPLGMADTHVHDDNERIVKNRAYSYERAEDRSFKGAFVNTSVVGGGGIYSTVKDLAKWVNNFDHGRVGGPAVLTQIHQQEPLNNGQTNNYAFGLFIDGYKGMRLVEHAGGIAGYRSDILRFPEQKVAVVLLANTSAIDALQLSRQVADIVLLGTKEPADSAEKKSLLPSTGSVDPAELDALCGQYEFKPGLYGTITREGNRLSAQTTGLHPGPKAELLPETANTFLVKEDGSRISFERNERGEVIRLIFQGKSGAQTARRITPQHDPLRAEELAEYIGDYSSEELGTTYTTFVRNGELFVQHRRLGDIHLTQAPGPDQFLGADSLPYHFAFTRDTRNQVTGFKLTGVRSRNLRFAKRFETVPSALSR